MLLFLAILWGLVHATRGIDITLECGKNIPCRKVIQLNTEEVLVCAYCSKNLPVILDGLVWKHETSNGTEIIYTKNDENKVHEKFTNRYAIIPPASLKILNVQSNDGGVYKCQVTITRDKPSTKEESYNVIVGPNLQPTVPSEIVKMNLMVNSAVKIVMPVTIITICLIGGTTIFLFHRRSLKKTTSPKSKRKDTGHKPIYAFESKSGNRNLETEAPQYVEPNQVVVTSKGTCVSIKQESPGIPTETTYMSDDQDSIRHSLKSSPAKSSVARRSFKSDSTSNKDVASPSRAYMEPLSNRSSEYAYIVEKEGLSSKAQILGSEDKYLPMKGKKGEKSKSFTGINLRTSSAKSSTKSTKSLLGGYISMKNKPSTKSLPATLPN